MCGVGRRMGPCLGGGVAHTCRSCLTLAAWQAAATWPGHAPLCFCPAPSPTHLPTTPTLEQEDEQGGRRRRTRADGSDDEGEGLGGDAELAWPSPGSDDEAEDEELLRRARTGQLLAESQGLEFEGDAEGGGGGSGSLGSAGGIPLDEGSQEVLGLLARCGSEPQLGGAGGSGPLPRIPSRLGPAGPLASHGSDPSAARLPSGGLTRGPSFVGRQPTVQRVGSSSAVGMGGGHSFVFGRDDSNSALPGDRVSWREGAGSSSSSGMVVMVWAAVWGPPAAPATQEAATRPAGGSHTGRPSLRTHHHNLLAAGCQGRQQGGSGRRWPGPSWAHQLCQPAPDGRHASVGRAAGAQAGRRHPGQPPCSAGASGRQGAGGIAAGGWRQR